MRHKKKGGGHALFSLLVIRRGGKSIWKIIYYVARKSRVNIQNITEFIITISSEHKYPPHLPCLKIRILNDFQSGIECGNQLRCRLRS